MGLATRIGLFRNGGRAGFASLAVALVSGVVLPVKQGQEVVAQALVEPAIPRVGAGAQAGRWQSDGPVRGAAKGLRVQIDQRSGDTIRGRVLLDGSQLLRNGSVEAQVRGGFVTGIVRDEQGDVAARFVGRVDPDGTMSGTYTDRTGEVGSWQWPEQGSPANATGD